MTREESIKELQESLDALREYDIAHSSRLKQALEMAIQALSQEPCDECLHNHTSICGNCKNYDEYEPCTDAVSREAVLDLAKKGILVSNGNYKNVCKAINELPSVTPSRRKGKGELYEGEFGEMESEE